MRTTDRIGFKLIIKEPDTAERTIVVCPRYDGLKLKWTKASGKVYHNKNIEGNVEFWGVDFVTLHNCNLRTKFTLVIFYKGRGEVARCEFRKTDCKWDIDHGTCKVDVSAWDRYKKLEKGKDNEYNVVKLPGMIKIPLRLNVYPQNQIYFQDDDIISLWGGEGVPAQPSVTSSNWDGVVGRGFGIAPFVGVVEGTPFSVSRSMMTENFNLSNGEVFYGAYIKDRGGASGYAHYLYFGYVAPTTSHGALYGFLLWDGVINGKRYLSDHVYGVEYLSSFDWFIIRTNTGVNDYVNLRCRVWLPFYGLATRFNEAGFVPISEGDITEKINHNYKTRGYQRNNVDLITDFSNKIAVSLRTSPTDKGYGKDPNYGEYYDTPDDSHIWYPVRKSSWFDYVSLWVRDFHVEQSWMSTFTAYETVDDFYLLGDVIKAVVNEIDSSIIFNTDEAHSQFLFAYTNPVSGQSQNLLYISQKSNILHLGYDYPAWLAPIKWSQIETFLKNALGCYYHIDENNHLHIEHITYYENGGNYYTDDRTLLDTTALIDVANRQPVAGKTNKWQWDKDGNGLYSSANRYEFSWMDTQSEIFDGDTIVIPDEYNLFTEDKLEDRKIDWFSSDIDFLTSVQTECSSDGFVVVMESLTDPGKVISGNPNYGGQNYELSLEYLQPKYLIQGIYAEMVRIGNTNYPNTFMARMRTAEVEFSMPAEEWETNPVTHETHDTWVSPDEIIKTDVGEGLIDNLEVDLHSGKWKATIRYENE